MAGKQNLNVGTLPVLTWRNLLLGVLASMIVFSSLVHMSAMLVPGVLEENGMSVLESQLHPEAFVGATAEKGGRSNVNLRSRRQPSVEGKSASTSSFENFDTVENVQAQTEFQKIYSLDKLRDAGYANALIKSDELEPEGKQILQDCPDVSRHVVYWQNLPKDKVWESPYKNLGPKNKYLLFEPDEGGWNNLRLGFEANLALAFATGRTFVLPPRDRVYLLKKSSQQQKEKLNKLFKSDTNLISARSPVYGFEDIFAMEPLRER